MVLLIIVAVYLVLLSLSLTLATKWQRKRQVRAFNDHATQAIGVANGTPFAPDDVTRLRDLFAADQHRTRS